MEPIKIHGFEVIGYLPALRGGSGFIVLVDRGTGTYQRYVTGRVQYLDDREWFLGHYHDDLEAAVRDLTARSMRGISVS